MSASRQDARPLPTALTRSVSDDRRGASGSWLTPLRGHWTRAAGPLLQRHSAVVRVTVAALAGSAPREPGATLLVHADGIAGTIGGGRLEWLAVRAAREMLRRAAAPPPVRLAEWILGPQLGQCCGGRVALWLERLTRDDGAWLADIGAEALRAGSDARLATEYRNGAVVHRLLSARPGARDVTLERDADDGLTLVEGIEPCRPRLWLFGAGHVGQALIGVIAGVQAFEVTWIDSRAAILPHDLPEGVAARAAAAPVELLPSAAAGTRYLVMTHDHGLDYQICRAVLERGDAAWLGLIGSASKAARFRSRLLRDGVTPAALRTLTCPIGVPGIAGKQPAVIAIAIAADLLQRLATGATPAAADGRAHAPADGCAAGSCANCGTRSP
jgi:xanthine dehydrogenase accessory factor